MSGAGGNLFEGSGDQRVAGVPADTLGLLRLSLIPGLGPVLIGRLVEACGSVAGALVAPERHLRAVRGIGPERARAVIDHREASKDLAQRELDRAAALDVRIIGRAEPGYPPLLAHLTDAPSILYVRGELDGHALDRYALAVVGSRRCTQYGIEQAERFAGAVAAAGLTIVSGGARGIDTAAHRAALRSGGRTVAVLGCGLAHVYPEENGPLFEQISDGRGGDRQRVAAGHPARTREFPGPQPSDQRAVAGGACHRGRQGVRRVDHRPSRRRGTPAGGLRRARTARLGR
ncbi:MAG: DNA-protecting protein DprA [Phycisphaeraceae bacterium]|nr:DNA-protecting protein DprA [Phycisphaeraceae bacterium]